MIYIVGRLGMGYPVGMAPTARVHAYARGLRAAGHEVTVVCSTPSEAPGSVARNTETSGEHNGILFLYAAGTTVYAHSFIARQLQIARGLLVACQAILRRNRAHDDVEAIMLYPDSIPSAVLLRGVSRWCRAPLLLEKNELPVIHRPSGGFFRVTLPVYERVAYRLFDGIVVISAFLEQYMAPLTSRRARLLRIPILFDAEASPEGIGSEVHDSEPGLIVYAGSLSEQKDGVLTLITAFGRVAALCSDARLVVIGGSPLQADYLAADQAVKDAGLESHVQFTGPIPRSRVFEWLLRASVLVLPRPDSPQARAGMPTKLSEYLASGTPVVMTRIGEQSLCLVDGETAFFVAPGSVDELTDALLRALADRDAAIAVGAAGRTYALAEFDAEKHGKRLSEFIAHLAQSR